jgi:Alpha-L-arabinofuranosidase B (ABFB) domain
MSVDTVSFRSVNFPDRFIRHKNFLGELELIVSDLDKNDASFKTRPGLFLGDGDIHTVSWESVNFPNHYLRHQDFRLKLHLRPAAAGPEQDLFDKDASFFIIPGLADGSKNSFRSANFNQRLLRHRDFHIFLDQLDLSKDLDRKDATFLIGDGFVPFPGGN